MYRLALALGKTLREIEEGMDGRELDRWRAYHEVEPIAPPGWMEAQICAVTANSQRAKGPPAKVEDFLPRVKARGPGRARQSPGEMMAAFKAATEKR